jgi:hypothetical protein
LICESINIIRQFKNIKYLLFELAEIY